MSILASLANAYERLPDMPPFGYARTEVGFCVVLNSDGRPAFTPVDFRRMRGSRNVGRAVDVPTPLVQRTSGIAPNFLWDKTAYSFGITASGSDRTEKEHLAFIDFHKESLADIDDIGAKAFLKFLDWWSPTAFDTLGWPDDIKDTNVVFALEDEYRTQFLHDRAALQNKWSLLCKAEPASTLRCLITGEFNRIARSHPPIKGVRKAQSSGAFIVSYNAPAFTSYLHEEGDNAPISEVAAFKYTAVLNRFLKDDSGNNSIQIGETSTVFWADSRDREVAGDAEAIVGAMFGFPNFRMQDKKIAHKLNQIVRGFPLDDIDPKLAHGVRLHVLGLAGNMARISIPFWFDDDFGVLTQNYQAYVRDIAFEPSPKDRPPITIGALALRTAPARKDRANKIKFDRAQVPRSLAGELLRAILTGARFPGALLPTLLMRVRSDHVLDRVRISLMKAVLVRMMRLEGRLPESSNGQPRENYLVRSDPADPNPARRLGRLFALIERAQLAALGDKINATVKDKYLGAAAATPEQVFSKLVLAAEQHHIKRLRNGHSDADWIKDADHARRVGFALNHDIGRLWSMFDQGLPVQHSNEEQGLFLVGYYQERFGKRIDVEDGGPSDDNEDDSEAESGEE
jgi:CRISPR-associated protein Csd1